MVNRYRQRGTGDQNLSSEMEISDQTGPREKSGPTQRVGLFFQRILVGPNHSIQFRTKISGNFGQMESTPIFPDAEHGSITKP